MERQRGLHSKIGFHAESCIDWHSLKSAVKKQTTGMKTMITKYIHGWLPTGTRSKLIHNGEDSCPQCKCQETNEHIITCRSPKARYTMGIRLSVMANAIQKRRSGTKVTPVKLDNIRHLMSNNEKPFTPHFVPLTSEKTKQIIYQSLKHQAHWARNSLFRGIW